MNTEFLNSSDEEKKQDTGKPELSKEHFDDQDLPPLSLHDDILTYPPERWHETMPQQDKPLSDGEGKSRVPVQIPHHGSLCRVGTEDSAQSPLAYRYTIEIVLENGDIHELSFERKELELMSRLFSILDTESRGSVGRAALQEFVTLRCPVFWRRDEDLRRLDSSSSSIPVSGSSPTFDEVWTAVSRCSKKALPNLSSSSLHHDVELGVEAWMVFCRFIALAQYLEAKRQFSARHSQQTMRHRNSPRGSEMVVVDVPPPSPPTRLIANELAEYERKGKGPLPIPELDLDHSLVAAHEAFRRRTSTYGCAGTVTVFLFGSACDPSHQSLPASADTTSPTLDFAVTYTPRNASGEAIWVRRSFDDMKWLNDTFASHKVLGGTLCGRILPPFPGSGGNALAAHLPSDEGTFKSAIGSSKRGTVAVASAGVDLLTSTAKSLWGSYVSSASSNSATTTPANEHSGAASGQKGGKKVRPRISLPESYYNPNSPGRRARQLQRYLNYLLEHPALSTSFPLNTILKASQSGLEAAKVSIADHAKSTRHTKSYIPLLVEGKFPIPFWSQNSASQSSQPTNLSWVRTAAQAAMALKVHGILETTGLPSASARLQHASLPTFDTSSSRKVGWVDEDNSHRRDASATDDQERSSSRDSEDPESFEYGVVHVDSELQVEAGDDGTIGFGGDVDGYDLLPLPVPAPERRILSAGSNKAESTAEKAYSVSVDAHKQARFHYGTSHPKENLDSTDGSQLQSAFLGEFSVDDNIDKLREVIGSVDTTLSRCLSAIAGTGGARRKRHALHLELVRGFDSWEGMRGQFITQRSMLNGVSGLERSRNVAEESDLNMIDDVSWQTSLARSAVLAADDVRSTVRAARTATNAKAAADAAAFAAQSTCESASFSSIDEARAAQTRSSVAQSHAIHAAVVEHEANIAKKRAALALAHDVKCWNVHRKRELINTCLAHAKAQHEASCSAAEAWSCLRDGFVGPSTVPFTANTRASPAVEQTTFSSASAQCVVLLPEPTPESACDSPQQPPSKTSPAPAPQEDEPKTVIYHDVASEKGTTAEPTIVPVDHDLLGMAAPIPLDMHADERKADDLHDPFLDAVQEALDDAPLGVDSSDLSRESAESRENVLSASMQSLVDGLMSWGGQYDADEDLVLPMGMAAEIVFAKSDANKDSSSKEVI